jgi:hypothetical protein
MENSDIRIYQLEDGKTEINVQLDNETVWLNLNQMVELFGCDKSVISRHISNIFKKKELQKNSVVAKNATTASDGKIYQVDYYNLDVIISVGYRIKSQRGTQFRIWANQIIKEYLIKGYSINEKRLSQQNEQLKELQESVKILGNVLNYKDLTNDESIGLLKIISDYAYALDILDQYDYQRLEIKDTAEKETFQLTYEEAKKQIQTAKKAHGNSDLFGHEKDDSFKSSISTIYQTFGDRIYTQVLKRKLLIYCTLSRRIILFLTGISGLLHFYFSTF